MHHGGRDDLLRQGRQGVVRQVEVCQSHQLAHRGGQLRERLLFQSQLQHLQRDQLPQGGVDVGACRGMELQTDG